MKRLAFWAVALVVAVLVSGCARNKPPVIVGVKAFPEQVDGGDSTDLLVSVTDPDNDPLKFKWTCRDGKFNDTKDSLVRWFAPEKPGKYDIKVTVTDKRGGTATSTKQVTVAKATSVYSGSLGGGDTDTRRGRSRRAAPQPDEPARKRTRPSRSGRTK
jgi:hypothetical protein